MSKLLGKKRHNKNNYIYVLKCEKGKFYIGRTSDPEKRFEEHKTGNGSEWTKKYKMIKVLYVKKGDPFDEDKLVKQYMANYGIDSVRGGSYSEIDLKKEKIEFINNEIKNAFDLCLKCGKSGHFAKDCNPNINIIKSNEGKQDDEMIKCLIDDGFIFEEEIKFNDCTQSLNNISKSKNYNLFDSKTKTDLTINGDLIQKNISKSLNGDNLDISKQILANSNGLRDGQSDGQNIQKKVNEDDLFNKNISHVLVEQNFENYKYSLFCSLCGRDSHTAPDCYAKTTVTGDLIYESSSNSSFYENLDYENNILFCSLCGRDSHTAPDCYAKTTVTGDLINESSSNSSFYENLDYENNILFCSLSGRDSHTAPDCYAKTTVTGDLINESSSDSYVEEFLDNCYKCGKRGHWAKDCRNSSFCSRCGRNNHVASECYAKTNISGKFINYNQESYSYDEYSDDDYENY